MDVYSRFIYWPYCALNDSSPHHSKYGTQNVAIPNFVPYNPYIYAFHIFCQGLSLAEA